MKIAVIGDLLLDVDLDGSSTRTLPDGPGPIIDVADSTTRPGGAGLVATLLSRDGHEVALYGALGRDHAASRLRGALPAEIAAVLAPVSGPTPVKSRVRVGGVTLARLDIGCAEEPAAPEASAEMFDALAEADAVVVSDYGRGMAAHPAVRAALNGIIGVRPVVWDPHPRGASPLTGIEVITPNLAEARGFLGDPQAAPDAAGSALRERWGARNVAVTLGEQGVLLCGDAGAELAPAPHLAVGDACGAGDRFAATVAAALASGLPAQRAVIQAAAATAEFLAEGGVGSLAAGKAERETTEEQHAERTAA